MAKIDQLIHACVVNAGPASGNKARTAVTASDVEYETKCEHCGNRLGTVEDLVLHMYRELTDTY